MLKAPKFISSSVPNKPRRRAFRNVPVDDDGGVDPATDGATDGEDDVAVRTLLSSVAPPVVSSLEMEDAACIVFLILRLSSTSRRACLERVTISDLIGNSPRSSAISTITDTK